MALHLASNNCYGVMCYNAGDIEESELLLVLEKYGKVQELQRGGPNVFAYYKQYEEARACLDALAEDPQFCAKPARPRETRPLTRTDKSAVRESRSLTRDPGRINMNRTKSEIRKEPNGRFASNRLEDFRRELKHQGKKANSDDSSTTSDHGDRQFKSKFTKDKVRFDNRVQRSHQYTKQEYSNHQKYEENSPAVTNIMDIWIQYQLNLTGTRYAVQVLIANLPMHGTAEMIYAITSSFVTVINVVLKDRDDGSCPYAYVYVKTVDDAILLKKMLNHRLLGCKPLIIQPVDDIIDNH